VRRHLSVSLAIIFLTVSTAFGENWPQFRGPESRGLSNETGLPVKWSATENVRWKTTLPGPGHSSPIVWGNRIFLTALKQTRWQLFGSPTGQLVVLALDKPTGKIVWEREIAANTETMHPTNSPASPTPATDGTLVYVYFGSSGVSAFDFDGKQVWHVKLGPYPNEWGSASSPVLYRNMVVLNVDTDGDDFLLALDKATGKTIWRTSRAGSTRSWPTPFIWNNNGHDQIVVSGSGRVKGYDPATGQEIWTVGGLTTWVTPTPVSAHGMLYVAANGPGGNIIMAIRPNGKGDITTTHVAWRYERSAPYISSPVVVGDYLYSVKNGGIMTCLNAKTGELAWQQRLPSGGDYYASLLAADGKIYAMSEDGGVTVLAAKPVYQPLESNVMNERSMASFAVSDAQIFIRTDASLFAIGAPRTAAQAR
jgi:outer membrane protein assembly factor BamB